MSERRAPHLVRLTLLALLLCATPSSARPQRAMRDPELGARLFLDTRLSLDQTMSCASCHHPHTSFSGPPQLSGQLAAPSLLDLSRQRRFGRHNPRMSDLQTQALLPLFSEDPVELGMNGREDTLIARLSGDEIYCESLFQGDWRGDSCALPDAPTQGPRLRRIAQALEAYLLTLHSSRQSAADRWLAGDSTALSPAATQGMRLFFGEAGCAACHGGEGWSDAWRAGLGEEGPPPYHPLVAETRSRCGGRPLLPSAPPRASKTPSLRHVAHRSHHFACGESLSLERVLERHAPNLTLEERAALTALLHALDDPAQALPPQTLATPGQEK